MGRKAIDLTGHKFGKLTVVGSAENTKSGGIRWECNCDCGGTKILTGEHIKSGGESLNCGCERKNLKSLVGNRYGSLTVVTRAENSKGGEARWECHCDCGNTKTVFGKHLRSGATEHCGCERGESLVGNRYGKLEVIAKAEKSEGGNIRWSCKCDCGNETILTGDSLKKGRSTHCGCSYQNSARTTHGLSDHRLYGTWHQMLQRCYNSDHIYYVYYGDRGIGVCERWHSVENFIEDIESLLGSKPDDSYTLDRIDGNGNYEPGNVRWASASVQRQNQLKHNYTSKYRGVYWHKSRYKWIASIRLSDGKQKHLGCFLSELEAYDAYKVAYKEVHGTELTE